VARVDLDELKAVRRVLGGTLNDVILAVIEGAFRDLLVARDEDVNSVVLRTLVPVSVRKVDDHTPNNQVSGVIARLPVGIAEPVRRFEAMRSEMNALKASHEAEAGEAMATVAGFTPPMLYALMLRSTTSALRRIPQHTVHTVTTNVPGPQHALYALGREMLEYLPFVPLSQGLRIGVAIFSYHDMVRFGVTGDFDTMPDIGWFCGRIETGVAELARQAGVKGPPIPSASSAS